MSDIVITSHGRTVAELSFADWFGLKDALIIAKVQQRRAAELFLDDPQLHEGFYRDYLTADRLIKTLFN